MSVDVTEAPVEVTGVQVDPVEQVAEEAPGGTVASFEAVGLDGVARVTAMRALQTSMDRHY